MKLKIPNLKSNFGSDILKRGYDYYKEGRVKDIIADGKKVKATVIGNRNYKVTLNLSDEDFKCTCPCDFNCKHAVAVIYELRNNISIETTDNIKNQLKKKSKEELVEILQKILVSEPKFKKFLSNKPEDIKKTILSLNIDYDEDIDGFIDNVDELYEIIMQQESKSKLDNLVILFKKCFEIWGDLDGVDPLENSMFDILESISDEVKKLPKDKRQKLLQEIVNLVGEFKFFLDSIDLRGVKIKSKI